MKKFEAAIRILLGLMLFIFGLNKFLLFIPMPPPEGDVALAFTGLSVMGIMSVVGALEVLGGLLLLINKQVGVALFFIAPIAFCAFWFHLMLDPASIGGAAFLLFATTFLIYTRRKQFMVLLD